MLSAKRGAWCAVEEGEAYNALVMAKRQRHDPFNHVPEPSPAEVMMLDMPQLPPVPATVSEPVVAARSCPPCFAHRFCREICLVSPMPVHVVACNDDAMMLG